MHPNNEFKTGFFPLFKLPRTFYDPRAKYTNWWSPFHHPSRSKRVFIAIILDWILILLLFGLTEWFFVGPQPPKAYFSLDDQSLKRPVVGEIISSTVATAISVGGPIILLLILEILFFWDRWNLYHLITGHFQAIALALFISSFFWVTIGGDVGLRPNFLSNCKPDLSKLVTGVTYYTSDICTAKLAKFEYQGFPSGHAATAFAGWVFFSLYFTGKSKPWSGGAHFWKILIILMPLVLATWVSMSRLRDFRHFPFQIIIGGLIGIFVALISYRLNFFVSGWFVPLGENSDHIPAHYHFIHRMEMSRIEQEDWEKNGNVYGSPRVPEESV
ncbi:hypothetical protein G9A89_010874 [Geosiphon pyriformis]|nr:hypothetical protein G9A89_010874 [Geosiphon pyriformis]